MEASEDLWEARYRDLEATLTQILQNFALVLDNKDRASTPHQQTSYSAGSIADSLKIRSVVVTTIEGTGVIYCVADGANLEFKFELLSAGQPVTVTEFGRPNCIRLPRHPVDECVMTVRSNATGQTSTVRRTVKWNG